MSRIHHVVCLGFCLINFGLLVLLQMNVVSYGPDLQDFAMEVVAGVALFMGAIAYVFLKPKGDKLAAMHYVLYAGFALEILYLMFES